MRLLSDGHSGERIKKRRIELGLTIKDVALKAELPEIVYSDFEERTIWDIHGAAESIARVLQTTVAYLFLGLQVESDRIIEPLMAFLGKLVDETGLSEPEVIEVVRVFFEKGRYTRILEIVSQDFNRWKELLSQVSDDPFEDQFQLAIPRKAPTAIIDPVVGECSRCRNKILESDRNQCSKCGRYLSASE